MYSKKIMKYFLHPKNMGKLVNPDGIGEAGNIVCGDLMKLYLKIGKNKKGEDKISDMKFECLGCAVAIANMSILTTMVKGKTLKEAMKIEQKHILKKLGEVPVVKLHCSALAVDALSEAIYDYYKKNKLSIPKKLLERHERVKKTIEILEKGYKEHIGSERILLDKK